MKNVMALTLGLFISGAAMANAGPTTVVSVGPMGEASNDSSYEPAISDDGRYVAFASAASNLVDGDTNEAVDIFLHDRRTGITSRVSVDSMGGQADESPSPTWGPHSFAPSISADGRVIAFNSVAEDLVADDNNLVSDVFVHDRMTGQSTRVSKSPTGAQVYQDSYGPVLSRNGRLVAFSSDASLVAGDTNGARDVFVRDRLTGLTTRASVATTGQQANGPSSVADISDTGKWVTFLSEASNLVDGDTNEAQDVFLHHLSDKTTIRVSVDSTGAQGNSYSYDAALSGSGRFVAFSSGASNLVPGDTNDQGDVFVYHCKARTTTRVSVSSAGTEADGDGSYPAISGNGRFVSFGSDAPNLVPGETNFTWDLFVHDRRTGKTTSVTIGVASVQSASSESTLSGDGRFIAFASHEGVSEVLVHDRK